MRTMRIATAAIFVALAAAGVARMLYGQSDMDSLAQTPEMAKCTLKVTGMTCGGCAAAVKSAAKKVNGVRDAQVSYEKGLAEITYDPSKTNPKAIAQGITERSGFKAQVQRSQKK